jgi:hypothetical protein
VMSCGVPLEGRGETGGLEKHFQERSAEPQIPRLPPDFLSRVAASVSCVWFSFERTTSGVACESSEAGNPGTLGMTKRRGQL